MTNQRKNLLLVNLLQVSPVQNLPETVKLSKLEETDSQASWKRDGFPGHLLSAWIQPGPKQMLPTYMVLFVFSV